MTARQRDRDWALPAAAGFLALENVALLGGVLFVGNAPPLVPAFLLAKFPFCAALVRRRHGAFMFLTLWEASVFVIGLLNPSLDLIPRLLVLGASTGGLVLLGLALSAFPETHLPDASLN